MKIKDVTEWIQLADEDLYSAKILNAAPHPHKYEANDTDIQFSLNAVERIMNLNSIINIRNEINSQNNDDENIVKQPNGT